MIPSNFIDSESGVTIYNQLRIRRPEKWRHRASDRSTSHRTLPIPIGDSLEQSLYLQHFSRYRPLSVLGSRRWPFKVTWRHLSRDHSIPRWSFPISAPLSSSLYLQPLPRYWAVYYWGHESRPWPFRVSWRHRSRDHSISRYPFSIGAPFSPSRYIQPFPRFWALSILGSRPSPLRVTWCHRSRDHWTRDGLFLLVVRWTQVSISNSFRDIPPQTSCGHWARSSSVKRPAKRSAKTGVKSSNLLKPNLSWTRKRFARNFQW